MNPDLSALQSIVSNSADRNKTVLWIILIDSLLNIKNYKPAILSGKYESFCLHSQCQNKETGGHKINRHNMTDWMPARGSHYWAEFLERLIISLEKENVKNRRYVSCHATQRCCCFVLFASVYAFSWFSSRSRYTKDFPQSSHPHCIGWPWLIIYAFFYPAFQTLGFYFNCNSAHAWMSHSNNYMKLTGWKKIRDKMRGVFGEMVDVKKRHERCDLL